MANLKDTTIDSTGFLRFPVGTTDQRPSSPTIGMMRVNTDRSADPVLEFWDGEDWLVFGGFEPIFATGGTVEDVDIDGITYRIHSFVDVGSHTFEVQSLGSTDGDIEFLVVAGGGSGGSTGGGGGGAGGLVSTLGSPIQVSTGSYTVTVGSGAPRATGWNNGVGGGNGNDSSAFGFTARGGGGGADHPSYDKTNGSINAGSGGSGGGGRESSGASATQPGTNPSAVIDAGNPGGDGNGGNGDMQGGGGAAGSAGQAGSGTSGGDGGVGIDLSDLIGSDYGENGYFAGGGGSGIYLSTSNNAAKGGIGGGGDGGQVTAFSSSSVEDGQPNTGGGGGGGGYDERNGSVDNSGAGGSGVVIIRYRAS